MRRVSFFVLLGPLLSWLTFVAMLSPKLLMGPRWIAALAMGGFGAQFVMFKMEEIAQKISATKDET